MSAVAIPPARREMLDAMSDLRLMAEIRDLRKQIARNTPQEERGNLAARFANEALRESLSSALTVADERGI